MSDRAPPPALPWACVDTPSAKRVRTETQTTGAASAAEDLQPPLFGLKLGDRIEVVWEYKHDDDDDDDNDNDTVEAKVVSTALSCFTAISVLTRPLCQWCPATLEACESGGYQLRYDADAENGADEGEVQRISFVSPCRLTESSPADAAPAAAVEPGTGNTAELIYRRHGSKLIVNAADIAAGVDAAVYDDKSAGDEDEEEPELDAWFDAASEHIATLPVVDQQRLATSISSTGEFIRTLVSRLVDGALSAGHGPSGISAEHVREAADALMEELQQRKQAEPDTQ